MFWIRYGSLMVLLAVALGAFGAHGLRDVLDNYGKSIYQTAVLYHLVHGLGLVLLGCITLFKPESSLLRSSGWLMLLGIVLFSGSLYVLGITGIKRFGMITPVGGAAFLAAWLCLALAAK